MKLDHIVHFIHENPSRAANLFQLLGFHSVKGGQHEQWGTANSLSYFDLTYLEFLAIEDAEKAAQSENPLVRLCLNRASKKGGICQMAFRTENIEKLAEYLQEQGFHIQGLFPGSRKRADGKRVEWKMLFAENPEAEGQLPFFIQWEQTDEERRIDLIETGAILEHSNGVSRMIEAGYVTEDPAGLLKKWQRWYGLEKVKHENKLYAGDQMIAFIKPSEMEEAEKAFQENGAGPFYVSFSEKDRKLPKEFLEGVYFF
ncbi:VOC family protein [Metabacillus sp. RGM 3146]|uniref:VOC family protein n=1 Tax=Metabacillus sp. RGM 3146 TaxID=3401092 RepID=UPI003B9BAFAC